MEILVSIAVLGMTYALVAAGIVLVYKASRVVNFAHGEIAIVCGYLFYSAGRLWPAEGFFPAFATTLLFSLACGVVIYLVLMRRLLGEPTFVAAMVTIALAIIFKAAIVVVWRSSNLGIPMGRQILLLYPDGGALRLIDLVTLATGALCFIGLGVFFRYARLGRQFRGAAENALLASQRQVDINLILSLAWAAAVFAAAIAGVLFGSRSMLSPQSTILGLSGLTAAMVGGLDSLRGALLGGFLVAGAIYLTARLIDPALSEAVPFIILLAVMAWKPWGLFGTREELDRV